jgi:Leucine-rich repeat (LRR) protein
MNNSSELLSEYHGVLLDPSEAEALETIESIICAPIPLLTDKGWDWKNFGYKLKGSHVFYFSLLNRKIKQFPDAILKFKELTHLVLEGNKLLSLPESIGELSHLEWLMMTDNQLQKLPESIGNLQDMLRLSIARNQLTTLPDTLCNLKKLEKLWIMENPLDSHDEAIKHILKGLKKHNCTIYDDD